MGVAAELWGGIQLPEWTNDSPARLFELFQKHSSPEGLDRWQLDEYTRLLMHVVAIGLRKGRWDRSMPKLRIDPADVAQEILAWLVQKTRGGMGLRSPAPLVLLATLYTTITRRIVDAVGRSSRRTSREILESDYYCIVGSQDDSGGPQAATDAPDVADVFRAIDRCESKVLGDLADREIARELYRSMRVSLQQRHALPGYHELPQTIREHQEMTIELHAQIQQRFLRLLAELADGYAAD